MILPYIQHDFSNNMSSLVTRKHEPDTSSDSDSEDTPAERRVTFNPIANKRQPSDENGDYDIVEVPLRPGGEILTSDEERRASARKEDILFTFMWVLNEWDGGVNCVIPSVISRATAKRNATPRPYGEMTEPTYEELFLLCGPLITKLENGESVTLSGRAGRMMVTDIASVQSLAAVLKPIMF